MKVFDEFIQFVTRETFPRKLFNRGTIIIVIAGFLMAAFIFSLATRKADVAGHWFLICVATFAIGVCIAGIGMDFFWDHCKRIEREARVEADRLTSVRPLIGRNIQIGPGGNAYLSLSANSLLLQVYSQRSIFN